MLAVLVIVILLIPKDDIGNDIVVSGEKAITSTDVRYGKVTFEVPEEESYKCNSAPFSPPFMAKEVFVQLAPSRSSIMTRSLLQAVTVWLEWANSTGFAACVETSGLSDVMRIVNVNWLAFRGQPTGGAAGIVDIPFWTSGTSDVDIAFPLKLNPVPEVFVTPIHSIPQDRQDAASVWSEDVASSGFKLSLREVTNFSGGHRNIRVQWIALVTTPKGWKMPEKSKIKFKNVGPPVKRLQYSYCEDVTFKRPFYLAPVVLLSPRHKWKKGLLTSIDPNHNAITSWLENLDRNGFTACVKDLQLFDKHHDPITVQYVAFGDLDPCHKVVCSYYATCTMFGPNDGRCVCSENLPRYEDEQCSEDSITYRNFGSLERQACLQNQYIGVKKPGSCEPFLFYRGRVFVYLSRSEAECRLVSLSNTIFNVNKSIHVQLAVNYFNSSGQFTHEAAVTWTEDVSAAKFRICVLTAGRLDRLPPDSGLTYVDFIAYQGNPVGSVTGHESLVSWWDGTSCQEIVLPQGKFSSPPYVLVSSEHTYTGRSHDAATVWAENVEVGKFAVCLREMQNFDGLHENIVVDWIAFLDLPKEMMVEWHNVTFSNNQELESLRQTNYAFCQCQPVIAHIRASAESNSISTWVENINTSECRVCMKELHTPQGYDPVFITVLAVGAGSG
ncbi:hypothetical protein OS493_006362 [Desmophyllum pertusum]|uniref:Uncharacterized protein n=1 Tax=Desmophyllum pertusum TaxID=174260 RepID=A0A9X0DB18_9CNID|nr:hypothetical protein OS493_006362 [Desmophyllum pertusum]